MFLLRGIAFSHEAVRDWGAKLTPALAEKRTVTGVAPDRCQPTPEPPSLATRIRPPPHAFFAAAPVSAAVVLSSPERRFSRRR